MQLQNNLPAALLSLAILSLVPQAQTAPAGPRLKEGDRLAIVGDSITEQKQYSKFIETYLLACMPQLEIQCLQFGWGGERAPGFASRMENDLVPWKPTVVTTCYGMNDGGYRQYEDSIGNAYEKGMRDIIDRMKQLGARVVVGSPGVVDSETWAKNEPDRDKVYNENLGQLREIARKLATENGFAFADVFGTMMTSMVAAKAALGNSYHVGGGDGVHPAANGHLAMAAAFLKALGMDGNLGSVTIDLKSGKSEAAQGHRVTGAAAGTAEIESTRYPFCFQGDDKDPNGTRSILPYLPFNEELNRFTLVVKGLTSPRARVQWGEATRSFTREQLAAGINLAAEFPDNPFVKPFHAVMDAVAQKQNFETPMIKDQINRFRFYTSTFGDDPEVANALAVLRGKLIARDNELHRDALAARKPVVHRISVTAAD